VDGGRFAASRKDGVDAIEVNENKKKGAQVSAGLVA
jgi:hypothetical protein